VNIPRADSFAMTRCHDPECGLHLFARDENHKVLCELVMSREEMLEVISAMQQMLSESRGKLS
jgi:hypothetical protein